MRLGRSRADDEPSRRHELRCALVGAGPASLTAAWFLGLKGHDTVIYEGMPETGGMLLLGKSMDDDPVGFDFSWDQNRFMEQLWLELAEFVPGSALCSEINTTDGGCGDFDIFPYMFQHSIPVKQTGTCKKLGFVKLAGNICVLRPHFYTLL